ncbi:MAG TPA: hypothetical protein VGW33_07310 [Terriglobia bacterium]|nr:hypothetical protein [Terriglobia bacterium]
MKNAKSHLDWGTCILALLVGLVATPSAQAQTFKVIHSFSGFRDAVDPPALTPTGSSVVGVLGSSRNARLGGDSPPANQVILDGDQLTVRDGTANLTLVGGSRILVGGHTDVSFHRDSRRVVTDISRGRLEFFNPGKSALLARLDAGNLSITAGSGGESLGEVVVTLHAMIVSALRGSLHIEGADGAFDVPQGKEVLLARKLVGSRSKTVDEFPALAGVRLIEANHDASHNALKHLCTVEEHFEHDPFDALLDDICDKHQDKIKQLCADEAKDDLRPSPYLPERSSLDQAVDNLCAEPR